MKNGNKIKWVRVSFTNSYILECNQGYLLIDVGYPQDYESFIEKLKINLNIKLAEIQYLLLTHHHDDHAGFAAQFMGNSKAKLIVHENALERLKIGASERDSKPVNKRIKHVFGIFEKFHEFVFPPVIPNENDIILRGSVDNNQILKNIGIDGSIIFTPGHTNDGISVILSDGSVFCGDNCMNAWYFNILGIKKRPIFLQNIELISESWERYLKLGGKIIYPAHGKPFKIQKLVKELRKF